MSRKTPSSPKKRRKPATTSPKSALEKDLQQTEKLISTLLVKLEEQVRSGELDHTFWGERESVVSVLTKMTQILSTIVDLQQQSPDKNTLSEDSISEEDDVVIREFFSRYYQQKPPQDTTPSE